MCFYSHFQKKSRILIVFILIKLCLIFDCSAQSFSLQNYTIEDGLLGTTIYSLDQDEKGILWISTDAGICTFDGRSFTRLNLEGLKGEIIFLRFDSKGRLWMIDLANKISMYHNGVITRYDEYFSGKISKYLFEDKNENIWITHTNGISVLENPTLGKKLIIKTYDSKGLTSNMFPYFGKDSSMHLISILGVTSFPSDEPIFYPYKKEVPKSSRTLLQDMDYRGNSILLVTQDRIYSIDVKTKEINLAFTFINDLLKVGARRIYFDNDANVIIATKDGILYNEKKEDGSIKTIKLLDNFITQNIYQDHEKNIWFVTQNNGLFKLSSNEIITIQSNKVGESVTAVNSIPNQGIVLGDTKNTISFWDKNLKKKSAQKINARNEKVYDIAVSEKENTMYVAAHFGLVKYNLSSLNDYKKISKRIGFKTCRFDKDGRVWVGTYDRAGYLDGDLIVDVLKKRTYSILPLGNLNTWFGTVDGLFFCKNKDCEIVDNELLHQDIRDIQLGKDSTLWIATQASGLVLFKDGKILQHYTSQNGLSGDNCQKILLGNRFAWIATNKGITRIKLDDFSFKVITLSDGLPSNDVKYLHKKEKKIYAATSKGLAVFDEGLEIYSTPPILSISSFQINNVDTLLGNEYTLPHTSSDIKITYNCSAFKNGNSLKYQYKLVGLNNNWMTSNVNIASFPSLSPGNYSFHLRAKTINSDWTQEQQINFTIKKPYWQTWWFYSLILISFFIIGAKFFQLIINNIKRRNEVQQKLKESELTALRAQMDPHFLFNSLNSIQEFIVTNDKRSANFYLSQFSRLVRNILNTSDKNEILVKKEIETLKLYLNLESLRFEKDFEYQFEVDENLDIDNIYIPSMLIQPFIENAIKHGLMHKKGTKNLFIRFFKKENFLTCEIEDNGIGREESMKIKKQNPKIYQSKGMNLTRERINLLNTSDNRNLKLDVIDLKDKNEIALGTKVIIHVQINYKK